MAPVYLISTALEAITADVTRIPMARTVKNVSTFQFDKETKI